MMSDLEALGHLRAALPAPAGSPPSPACASLHRRSVRDRRGSEEERSRSKWTTLPALGATRRRGVPIGSRRHAVRDLRLRTARSRRRAEQDAEAGRVRRSRACTRRCAMWSRGWRCRENRIVTLPEGLLLGSLAEASNYIHRARRPGIRSPRHAPASRGSSRSVPSSTSSPHKSSPKGSPPGRAAGMSRPHCLWPLGVLEDVRAVEDLERVRLLFEDLDTKKDLIRLLGLAGTEGVRIFIGSENKLFSLSGSAWVIVSPFEDTERDFRWRPWASSARRGSTMPGMTSPWLTARPPAWPPCPLIFRRSRSCPGSKSRSFALIRAYARRNDRHES